MIVRIKNGTQGKVPFSDLLKNSSTLKNWIYHKKIVNENLTIIRSMEKDSLSLKSKMPVLWTDMIVFCLEYWASKNEFNLLMLTEKHQDEREEALTKLNLKSGLENGVEITIVLGILTRFQKNDRCEIYSSFVSSSTNSLN